jgi:diguanylate cyclase (GGDEF)-like protein
MWPKQITSYKQLRPFLAVIGSLLTLLVGGFALFLYLRTDRLLNKSMYEQADAYCDLIVHAKEWNSDYGGIYVENHAGYESDPYLRKLGVEPDIQCSSGKTFTLLNHAVMLEEISRMSEKTEGVKFRLVGLTPINPANKSDALEKRVLKGFTEGSNEYAQLDYSSQQEVYRYIRPLIADLSCLKCHRSQGYSVGDVIGAISITIPVRNLLAENRTNKAIIIFGAIAAVVTLAAATFLSTWRLVIKLEKVQRHLVRQASTDELTGLMNRRNIMKHLNEDLQRSIRLHEPLSIMILDLDHFKQINDTYGHLFGDEVLKNISSVIRDSVRSYDSVGRIGGEEFLIISPGIMMKEVLSLAERIRGKVSEAVHVHEAVWISMTVSIGVTSFEADDFDIASLLKRADRALYHAKETGRNRVSAL